MLKEEQPFAVKRGDCSSFSSLAFSTLYAAGAVRAAGVFEPAKACGGASASFVRRLPP